MDNQFDKINLAGNQAGGNQPIFAGFQVQAPVFNSDADIQIQPETVAVQEPTVSSDVADDFNQPQVIDGDLIVPTAVLRYMVSQARIVGVATNVRPASEVINLIFDENGITVRSTSGENIDYECINRNYIIKKPIKASVDIALLGDYLNVERQSELLIEFDEIDNNLKFKTATGTRVFAQRMDGSTHQPVEHKISKPYYYDEMMSVDYKRFMGLLAISSSARELANNSHRKYLSGLYCGDSIIVASDGNVMTIQENNTEFNDKIFFIGNRLCNALYDVDFDAEKFRIGFTETSGFVSGLTVSDGNVTLCGDIRVEEEFPVSVAEKFWKLDSFNQRFEVNTKDFEYVVKSISIFIPSIGDFVDKISIDISGDTMALKCLDDSAREVIKIGNSQGAKLVKPVLVSSLMMSKIVKSIESDSFDILIDDQNDSYICLSYDNSRSIVTQL